MDNNIERNNEQNEEITAPQNTPEAVVATSKKPFPWWIIAVAAAVVILAVVLVIALVPKDNGDGEGGEPVYSNYTVTVVDALNNPMPNVMVKFTYPDGETTKTRVTGTDGAAVLKNVLVGKYTVKLEKGYSDADFDISDFELTEDFTSLKVIVRDEAKSYEIYGEIGEGTFAYNISAGSYNIPHAADYKAYFVFYAQSTGVYKITLDSLDSGATVGFYGIPQYVQATHRGDGEYDGKSFELTIQDTDTPYVIGVSTTKVGDATLKIERTGDAPFDPDYLPWTEIKSEAEIIKCTLPEGSVLHDLNVTDPTLSVTLGDDGYYYTSDGKLVYLRINSVSNAKYLDVSIAFIAGLVDKNFGQNFGGYVYDDDGNFVGKYTYNSLLASYYENLDENGVYPLTAELAEAIKCHGNSTGWWKPNTVNYLFAGVPVVAENAWLFLCCTIE